MLEEYENISMSDAWIETFKHGGERIIPPMKVSDRLRATGMDPNTPPGTFQMRPLVYKMFVHQVEKLGVQIQFGKRVIDYHEDGPLQKAIVITDQGERFEADVVIAADGVGSKSQRLVGGQVRARSSGRAMWRAAFPSEHLTKNPHVEEFFGHMAGEKKNEPVIRTFLG
jgi:2-polyprenyl-6-methoxyphenol hydroxylase-like FAD-dependent oxidoreductase